MTGSISVKILESNKKIENEIYKTLSSMINSLIKKNKNHVISLFKPAINNWIRSQPEINSLLSEGIFGSLNAQFGLPFGSADSAVNKIVQSITDTLNIDIKNIDKSLRGHVVFNFQQSDFGNLLGLSAGQVITERGTDLHWLDWLLTKGDTVIVIGYQYVPDNKGRSGGGLMYSGSAWRVPPQFSGTNDNNFITRAFDGREQEVIAILQDLFK